MRPAKQAGLWNRDIEGPPPMGAVISAVVGAVLAFTLAFTGVNLLASGPDNTSPVDKPLVEYGAR